MYLYPAQEYGASECDSTHAQAWFELGGLVVEHLYHIGL